MPVSIKHTSLFAFPIQIERNKLSAVYRRRLSDMGKEGGEEEEQEKNKQRYVIVLEVKVCITEFTISCFFFQILGSQTYFRTSKLSRPGHPVRTQVSKRKTHNHMHTIICHYRYFYYYF